jgi:hypothetical protein
MICKRARHIEHYSLSSEPSNLIYWLVSFFLGQNEQFLFKVPRSELDFFSSFPEEVKSVVVGLCKMKVQDEGAR